MQTKPSVSPRVRCGNHGFSHNKLLIRSINSGWQGIYFAFFFSFVLPGDFSLLNCSLYVNSSRPLTGVINLKLHPWTHFIYTRTPRKSWSLRLETGGYGNGAHFIWPSSARLLKPSLILRNIILLRLRNWKLSILEHTSNPSLWWAEVEILCVPGHTWIYSEFIANPVYKRPHFNSFL